MEEEAERNLAMKEVLAKLTKVHKVQVVEKEKQELRRKEDQEEKEEQKRQKMRVGRPERKDDYYIPSVPKNDPSLTVDQIQLLKYQRARALNNKASKFCRLRRKEKPDEMEAKLAFEEQKNTMLKEKLELYQDTIRRAKQKLEKTRTIASIKLGKKLFERQFFRTVGPQKMGQDCLKPQELSVELVAEGG